MGRKLALLAVWNAYISKIKSYSETNFPNKHNKIKLIKFGVLITISTVHKNLIHSTINERCLDMFAPTETWMKPDAPEAIKVTITFQEFFSIHQHTRRFEDKRKSGIAFI